MYAFLLPVQKKIKILMFTLQLQVPANTAHTFELNEPRFNFTEIIITFSYYIERPASWTNYTDVLALQPPFETLLQDPSLTEAVFNSTDDVLFLSVTLGKFFSRRSANSFTKTLYI